ncbi:MAG: Fe(3+) ABC transporter substrate-binding protein [Wenzhouxiangellaceae bacterium]
MSRFSLISALFMGLATLAPAYAAEVNLYSARQENLIKPLLDRFTEETGITVNMVVGNADGLLQRLSSEGRNSLADVLLTVDAGRLYRAQEAGLTQPFQSQQLEEAIPATYRDPDGHWYGLSLRARTIMYAKDRVDPAQLTRYEDLADPRWKQRICIRSSSNIYNQSLVASLLAAHSEAEVLDWAKGLVSNMARPPAGGDRDQLKAVAAGQCDVAVSNTYYLVMMHHSDDPADRAVAEQIGVLWPNQDGRGVHVNVSGAALLQSSKNRDAAIRLIEFLASPESQRWYAETNGEYPVRPGITVSDTLNSWGDFKADSLNLSQLGQGNAEAVRLMDRAGWR